MNVIGECSTSVPPLSHGCTILMLTSTCQWWITLLTKGHELFQDLEVKQVEVTCHLMHADFCSASSPSGSSSRRRFASCESPLFIAMDMSSGARNTASRARRSQLGPTI